MNRFLIPTVLAFSVLARAEDAVIQLVDGSLENWENFPRGILPQKGDKDAGGLEARPLKPTHDSKEISKDFAT